MTTTKRARRGASAATSAQAASTQPEATQAPTPAPASTPYLSVHTAGHSLTSLQHKDDVDSLLVRKAIQLSALLSVLVYGGYAAFTRMDATCQNNVLWLAACLSDEVHVLADAVATRGEW